MDFVEATIVEAQQQGEFRGTIDAHDLSLTIVSTLQGAYVIARARRDAAAMESAVSGLIALLQLSQTTDPRRKPRVSRKDGSNGR